MNKHPLREAEFDIDRSEQILPTKHEIISWDIC